MTKLLKRSSNINCWTIKRKDLPVVVPDYADDYIARLMKRTDREDVYMDRIMKRTDWVDESQNIVEKRSVCPDTSNNSNMETDQDSYLFTLTW